MDTGSLGWWRRHGWTVALLLLAFGIAFSIRTVWSYPIVAKWGPLYTYAGGSDSYYHSRVMTYIIQTGHNLVYDPMLKFPIGSTNPREPLFDWMNAILGNVFAPAFGGNAVVAGAWFLDLEAPLWAALCVFPIYLIGREVSGRRTGLIAALVYPFFTAGINSSTFGYANYLSFYTFVLLVVVYSYLRTTKALGHRRYVERYRDPKQYLPGLRSFFATERVAVKWSVFTGVALGALALSWQGYTYGIVVVAIALLVGMIIERLRRVDSFGYYVSTWIIGLVAFPMAAPYYLVQHEFKIFFDVPLLLFFGTLALLLPFLLMRDVPWVFSIPTLVAIVGVAAVGLKFLAPVYFSNIVTGQGYFVKTLVYTTVAEAQAPSIDELIIGYGVVTFFLAFVGLALVAYLFVHQRFKRHHVAFLVFAVISVYLPISATKFFLVGTPVFALLSAEALHRAIDVGGYPKLRRTVASLSDRRSRFAAFRKAFKARHVLVLALVVGLILPNVWLATDAGIPGNSKSAFAAQINKTIPSWLKLNKTAPGSNYLGAAGSSLDTPNQYDSAAYNWLAGQDLNVPEPKRPAFVSWWDYGFQAIDQGQHPSVADNFQNGIDPAGQFLLSQNESLAIAILATTLLQGELQQTHATTLPSGLASVLTSDGVNVTNLNELLSNAGQDYNIVVHDPAKYLPVNPNTITSDNAMYLAVSYYLAGNLPLSGVARVYDDVQAYTGWSIRYAMTDSRLIPFSGSNTGIFYAPADLTGRVINNAGIPTTFYNVSVFGSDGQTYPAGQVPAGVTAVQYNISYSSPFYNTMLYKIYFGYNGSDVGQGGGIPGLTGAAAGDRIEPGFMLQHFEAVYKTAYVCPNQRNATPGAGCFHPVNYPDAPAVANQTHGTADLNASSYFSGGETMLAYYPGEQLLGKVELPGGAPVPGVRVTVYDGWNIPHMSAVTASDGTFALVLPPGNDTLNITSGKLDKPSQAGTVVLSTIHLNVSNGVGYSLNAPPLTRTFQIAGGGVDGLVYFNVANNSSYVPGTDPLVVGAHVTMTGGSGSPVLGAVTDASGTFHLSNVPPQVYNVSVQYGGRNYSAGTGNITAGATANLSVGLTASGVVGKVTSGAGTIVVGARVTLANASGVVASATTGTTGTFQFHGLPAGNYTVSATILGTSEKSQTAPAILLTAGTTATVNLTVEVRGVVSVSLSAFGKAAANVPVEFVPMVNFANGSQTPLTALEAFAGNTALGTTDATGFLSIALPPGDYAVEAQGLSGGSQAAALGTVRVLAGESLEPISLSLSPAVAVAVHVGAAHGSSASNHSAVLAFGAARTEAIAWTMANGVAHFWLPAGVYSFLAVGTTSSGTTTLAALATANVTATNPAVTLALGPAVTTHFDVGSTTPTGGFAGAAGANVTLTAGPSGPSVATVSGTFGATGLVVPLAAPGSSTGYCVQVVAFGYATNSSCGLAGSVLANLTHYAIPIQPVAVTLKVVGLPPATPVTVNFTAKTQTAENVSLTGGPTFALELPPGVYGVGAKAVVSGSKVYLPPSVLSTTIPLGATYSNLTLVVVLEFNATGTIALPTGATLAGTTVNLTSSLFNVSVNGTNFTHGFRATPTNYTATATVKVGSATYVNITRVEMFPNGTILPKIALVSTGVATAGALFRSTNTALRANLSATLVTAGGASTVVNVTSGTFHAVLPAGTYRIYANTSLPVSTANGTYNISWNAAAGASCTVSASQPYCNATMLSTVEQVTVHGTLDRGGFPYVADGTVRLVGPLPSRNVTVVNATLGAFSATLFPGSYFAYATTTGVPTLAGFARFFAFPSSATVAIALAPTWTVSVGVAVASPSNTTAGLANVTVEDAFGNFTVFPAVSPGSPVPVPLPLGTYTVSAAAKGTLNHVNGTAVANATVDVASGNIALNLGLVVPSRTIVTASIVGSPNATVAAGGQVSYAFSVRNTGNVPVTVHPVGTPSSWNFSFSFANATLLPNGPSLSGEVRITVPPGTPVRHPPLTVSFQLANGTATGGLSPPPSITVLGYYGVKLVPGTKPGVEVGPTHVLVPFYLNDTGNQPETAFVSIVDSARLAALGWSSRLLLGTVHLKNGLVNLSAGAESNLTVNLTTNLSVFVPPGSVTLEANVTNASSTITSTVTIPVPRVAVSQTSGPVTVTGPSVASGPSPYPAWLVPLVSFVPAIALAVGLAVRRWWKTRRWVRR